MIALFSGLLFGLVLIPPVVAQKLFVIGHVYCGCRSFLVATGRNLMHSPSAHGQVLHELPKSEARYSTVADAAFDAIVAIAPDGVVQWFNRGAERMFGYKAEEVIGRPVTLLMPERYRDLCVATLHRDLRTGQARVVGGTTELVGLHQDGSEFPIEMSLGETHENGKRLFTAVIREVTERKEVEKVIKESEECFRSLVQYASDIITILKTDGTVRYVSPAVERVMGYKPEEQVGTSAFGSVHPDDRERALATFAEVLKKPGLHPLLEFRVLHRDGSWRNLEHVANNLLDDPAVRGVVVNSRDVTERMALEEQLRHQAFHDPLTGLPNRALFIDRLEHALALAHRRGTKVAVLFTDLDNFKVINDSVGHAAGDQLLIAIAERLKACVRPEDTAARLGGDEFAILVEGVTGVGEVVRIAERMAEMWQLPFDLEEQGVFATASTGIAINDPAQEQPADLLRHADLAMYRAKHRGKASYEVFEPGMGAKAVSYASTRHLPTRPTPPATEG
jgi:diguanylate cyclase (GGDEF)-like protein/PAS domain S-box-containing protein